MFAWPKKNTKKNTEICTAQDMHRRVRYYTAYTQYESGENRTTEPESQPESEPESESEPRIQKTKVNRPQE